MTMQLKLKEEREEGKAEGRAEGRAALLSEIISNMLRLNKSPAEIATMCGCTEEEILHIRDAKTEENP